MDVLDMYKHLSLSIWPQSQITEINFCFKATARKPYISISWPIFVLKDNYNRYYHKKCRNVTSPSKGQLLKARENCAEYPFPPPSHPHTHPTKKADKSRDRSESIGTWKVSKITKYSWKKWKIEQGAFRWSNKMEIVSVLLTCWGMTLCTTVARLQPPLLSCVNKRWSNGRLG